MIEKLGQIGALWPIFAKNSIFHHFRGLFLLERLPAPHPYLVCVNYISRQFKNYDTQCGAEKRSLVRKKTLHFLVDDSKVDLSQNI